jgi:hypothetical protein
VDHDLTSSREVRLVIGLCALVVAIALDCTVLERQIERGLGPGEIAERLGPSCVERQLRPEGFLRGCVVGDGAVEVEGVRDVDLRFDTEGAVRSGRRPCSL